MLRREGGAAYVEPSRMMLQSYGEMVPDLSYYHHQVNMGPASTPHPVTPEYPHATGSTTPHWYNSPPQSISDEYYGGRGLSKTPEWPSYQEQTDYNIPPTPDNSVCSRSSEGPYQTMVEPVSSMHSMESLMAPTTPLLPSSLCPNLEPAHQPSAKEDDSLTRPQVQSISKAEENKDTMKLPGFHQTFGTITEIGRFSQHDDYFESRPDEIVEPVKVEATVEPKQRKPRGRKRKVAEARYCEEEAGPQYGNWGRHHCCPPEPPPCYWPPRHHPYYPSHYNYYQPHYPYAYQPPWPRDYLLHNYPHYV